MQMEEGEGGRGQRFHTLELIALGGGTCVLWGKAEGEEEEGDEEEAAGAERGEKRGGGWQEGAGRW